MRLPFIVCVASVCFGCANAADDPLATLRAGHPRLLCDSAGFAAMRAAAVSDPLRARLHDRIVETALAQRQETPVRYDLDGPRLLGQSRKALAHISTSAAAYRLTGRREFLEQARDVMLTAAGFPDWNPSHFLDVAEMATALGLGYDWLFDDLAPEERAVIKRALLDKALAYAGHAYARADPDRESYPFVKGNLTNNWNQVCNGGFLIAALALAEDEPDLARVVIAGVRDTLPHAMEAYRPDGAYPEGPVYWGYGTRFNVLILAALESALGHDLGLGGLPAFDRTALFRCHVRSPTGLSFNFADGRAGLGADSGLTWLAQRYGHPTIEAQSRAFLEAALMGPPVPADRFLATHAIWFPRPMSGAATLPLDVCFEGPSKVAIMRGSWDDPHAVWTGLKAGSNRVNHGHLDAGAFMLDADGVRWAVDLGPDDYNLPGYWSGATVESPRWQYYRLNNRSHNTITPGDELQSPDADAPIVRFESRPERAFAIADLTSAYPGRARRFQRGLALLGRARVLVQDQVAGLRANTPLAWRMLTPAAVSIAGPVATLAHSGRSLRIEILEPAGVSFVALPAKPPTAVEEANDGITALTAEIPATAFERDVRLAVLLSPEGERWPAAGRPDVRALEDWR